MGLVPRRHGHVEVRGRQYQCMFNTNIFKGKKQYDALCQVTWGALAGSCGDPQ